MQTTDRCKWQSEHSTILRRGQWRVTLRHIPSVGARLSVDTTTHGTVH